MPISYQRLIGKVEYNLLPAMENRPKALIIATDGTVKDGYGGAAVIIEDTKGNKLRSYLPVDGNPEQMDSFRAELCGILAGLIILHVLAKLSNKRNWDQFTAVFWTDSESSLKKINKSKELTPFSIREAVSKE